MGGVQPSEAPPPCLLSIEILDPIEGSSPVPITDEEREIWKKIHFDGLELYKQVFYFLFYFLFYCIFYFLLIYF